MMKNMKQKWRIMLSSREMEECLRLQTRRWFTYNSVVTKSNALQDIRTEEGMNNHISSLCKRKMYREALEAFDIVQKKGGFQIKPSTYTGLISACSTLRSLPHGRKIYAHVRNSNFQHDTILCNHILNMYGKCGSLRDARVVFDLMPQRNSVSYTSIISGYSQNGQEAEAVELYMKMLQEGFVPDRFAIGSVIKACASLGDVGLGKQMHVHEIKTVVTNSRIIIAQNALITMYVSFNQISEASKVFSSIKAKDLVSWGTILSGFSRLGYELEALRYFKELLTHGDFLPNEYIFGSALNACSSLLRADYGSQIHVLCIKLGFCGDIFAGCSLCDMYARSGFLESAEKAFHQIERPDTASWNAIITGFACHGHTYHAISIFSQMRNTGFTPDATSLHSLLCSCSNRMNLSQGRQIHSFVVKTGIHVYNSLLSMYGRCSDSDSSFDVFEEIRFKADSVSWNAILKVCLEHKRFEDILRLFKQMVASESKPDNVTIGIVLGACVEISSLDLGSLIHVYSIKTGLVLDRFITNGLIDMYAKCGSLGQAKKLFDSMENPDVVSWSSLIIGYAQSGFGEEALRIFREMRVSAVDPNEVTFLGVLTACSYAGLVEEGLNIYEMMQTEYGIVPTIEHCSCIVDLLARAGNLIEAEDFINQMKLESDVVVWKMILSASKNAGNLDVAKRSAEKIMKIDSLNSSAYVLMCGVHASSGNWKDVGILRKSMKKHEIRKVPGQSWIEVKKNIHMFFAEDDHHPERERIYAVLHELWLQMQD